MRGRWMFISACLVSCLACTPERKRLNPLDPSTVAEVQMLVFFEKCLPGQNEVRVEFPHGLRASSGADIVGKISIMPATGGQWQSGGGMSDPGTGAAMTKFYYRPANFTAGTTYTIQVTDQALDRYDRPFVPQTWTYRYPVFGNPGLAVTVSPAAPAAGSQPTFQWNSSDFPRYGLAVTKAAISQWNTGILQGSPTSLAYGTVVAGTALTSGTYVVTLSLFDNCNTFKNSATANFTVP